MAEYSLILNAGSSSLKFCVYGRSADKNWRVESRGQIEGIGTDPRMSVKNEQGEKLLDEKLGRQIADGAAAIDALAIWLRSNDRGGRLLGVGHRVVHGGPRFSSPTIVTRDVFGELKKLTPL